MIRFSDTFHSLRTELFARPGLIVIAVFRIFVHPMGGFYLGCFNPDTGSANHAVQRTGDPKALMAAIARRRRTIKQRGT
jgi:hypothetical protein